MYDLSVDLSSSSVMMDLQMIKFILFVEDPTICKKQKEVLF